MAADVIHPANRPPAVLHVADAVHEQEWLAVGDDGLDLSAAQLRHGGHSTSLRAGRPPVTAGRTGGLARCYVDRLAIGTAVWTSCSAKQPRLAARTMRATTSAGSGDSRTRWLRSWLTPASLVSAMLNQARGP